jgi:lipopolysaccharide export system protein LptA
MKKSIKFFLFSLLIIISFFFYKNYLTQEINNNENKILILDKNTDQINRNNLIKNLSYEVNFFGNKKYTIKAQKSEILNQDNSEIIIMNSVVAEYIDETNLPITITSNDATYNSSDYNSSFKKNVKIIYLDHLIKAENVYIDFKNNIILIKDNVRYEGPLILLKSDNIKIDLVTKNMTVFMDKKFDHISVKSKQ